MLNVTLDDMFEVWSSLVDLFSERGVANRTEGGQIICLQKVHDLVSKLDWQPHKGEGRRGLWLHNAMIGGMHAGRVQGGLMEIA